MIGVGIDLVDVTRFARVLERTPSLSDRVFTAGERAWCDTARHARPRAQRYAARFAAKEAAMKALGVGLGGIGWHDVEVVRGTDGAPALRVTGRAGTLAAGMGGQRWLVSLTHTADTAEAIVLLTAS